MITMHINRPNLTTREVLYTSKMCDFNVRYRVIRGPGINQLTSWTHCADIEVRVRKEGGERIVLCARCSFRGVAGYHSPGWKGRRPSSTPDGNLGFPEIFPLKTRLQLTPYGFYTTAYQLTRAKHLTAEVRDDDRSSSASKFLDSNSKSIGRLDKYKPARLGLRCKTILQTFGDVECSRRAMRLWLTEPWTQIAKVNYLFYWWATIWCSSKVVFGLG